MTILNTNPNPKQGTALETYGFVMAFPWQFVQAHDSSSQRHGHPTKSIAVSLERHEDPWQCLEGT